MTTVCLEFNNHGEMVYAQEDCFCRPYNNVVFHEHSAVPAAVVLHASTGDVGPAAWLGAALGS